MNDVHELSNTELAKALRCCYQSVDGCPECPVFKLSHCTSLISVEAANRLEGIVSITAARDAMAKELKKHGVVL